MNHQPDFFQAERTTATITVTGADLERTAARVRELGGVVLVSAPREQPTRSNYSSGPARISQMANKCLLEFSKRRCHPDHWASAYLY